MLSTVGKAAFPTPSQKETMIHELQTFEPIFDHEHKIFGNAVGLIMDQERISGARGSLSPSVRRPARSCCSIPPWEFVCQVSVHFENVGLYDP